MIDADGVAETHARVGWTCWAHGRSEEARSHWG